MAVFTSSTQGAGGGEACPLSPLHKLIFFFEGPADWKQRQLDRRYIVNEAIDVYNLQLDIVKKSLG
jgi:hypothetical protein